MSLEELLAVPVTSVAGVGRSLFSTPAAIASISGEELRRSGFLSLADAMRLVPGVFVGQSSSSGYSVGMRGFNGSLANKTLALIDGRAVYDPLFGGTFWNVQDVFFEDIDRIEVIRGPGATLWGANAVNGVINVLTKSAKDTQGLVVSGGVGTYELDFGSARYGFKVDDQSWMRIYGKWFERDDLVDAQGNSMHDDWSMARGGFRFDHEGSSTLTIQGDLYNTDRVGEENKKAPVVGQSAQFVHDIRDDRLAGGNVLARLSQEDVDSGWSLQGYYDRTERAQNVTLQVDRDTFDLDWRHHFKLGSRNEIMWGLGGRYTRDRTQDGVNLLLSPNDEQFSTFSAFIQDTITLAPEHWFAMIGSKVSHDSYTGLEYQPSARVWWTPDDRHTLWASVSQAIRVPSRTEEQGMLAFAYFDAGLLSGAPNGQIIPLGIQPNPDLESERLIAYELGHRVRIAEGFSVDTALFYNDYDRLIYVPSVVAPFNNDGYGETYGGEVALTWRPSTQWRLEASYTYTNVQIHGPVLADDERNTPYNQAQLRSYLDITKDLEFNSAVYYVDNVRQVNANAHTRLDLGVTWRVTPRFELAVWGQNLLDSNHNEFSSSEVPRGGYVTATWRF